MGRRIEQFLDAFTVIPKIFIALQADDVHNTTRAIVDNAQTSYGLLPGTILRPQAAGDYIAIGI